MITQENIPYTADEIKAMAKTIEELRKKYNGALERASKLRVQNPFDTVGQMVEHIFPELAESEDERIRECIIELVKQSSEILDKQNQKDMIAWLEKQSKETSWKPSKEEMDVLYGLAYITSQYDEHKEEVITRLYQDLKREFFNGSSYENMFPNTEDDVRRRSTIQVLEYARSLDTYNQYGKADIDKNIDWLESQAEQSTDKIEPNPAWREEDEEMLKWLCRIIHSQRVSKAITLKEESELGEWIDKWLNHNPQTKQSEHLENCDEDERTRKEIVGFITSSNKYGTNERCEAWLTWLEKQGEQKPTIPKWKYKKDHTPLLRDSIILNKYGCVAKSPSGAIVSDVWVLDYDELTKLPKEVLEKQGEQPTDKIEPKFKVGDWITTTDEEGNVTTEKIIEFRGDKVRLIDTNGFYSLWPKHELNYYHLWKIADANDGDVLVDEDNNIGLYSGEKDDLYWHSCIYLGCDGYLRGSMGYHKHKNTKPATKEQHDLLFTKMKEAGYEWDSEKKDLKKIEPKTLNADEVIAWLHDHIQVDEPKVEYSTDGQPLAESFLAHAKARCIAADEVVKQFKKDFGL